MVGNAGLSIAERDGLHLLWTTTQMVMLNDTKRHLRIAKIVRQAECEERTQ